MIDRKWIFAILIGISFLSIIGSLYFNTWFPFLFFFFPPLFFGGKSGKQSSNEKERIKYIRMNYCDNCGTKLQENWQCCPNCASPVVENPEKYT